MGDSPLKVPSDQPDDMANEGVIDPTLFFLEILVLELQIFVKRFESSLLPLIGCHIQPAVLSLICQGVD